MCGRFINISEKRKIEKIFNVNKIKNISNQSYNINPNENINVLYFENEDLILSSKKWGYNFFDKKNNKTQTVFNSRIETIKHKFLFRESFLKRKCIVIANGYYEWQSINNEKIPYLINIPNLETIYFAGIWRQEKINNNIVSVCCIITKEANNLIKNIHNRMPIIFSSSEALAYINDNSNRFFNNHKESEIENELDFYKISKQINNPKNNSKEFLKPLN